jgi:trimeric autotransporter adhesin
MKPIATLVALLFTLFAGVMQAQNVFVSGAIVGNGTYPTLGAAFTAINSGAQTGATIVVAITGNTTEPASAVLNQGTWTTLSILPFGGAGRTVAGNVAGPLIDLDGADRVAIDGLNTGGNSLTIDNTNNTTASTIRFINDAHGIAVQNATILGANTATTSGTILLSTGTVTGNDSIVINTCNISESGVNFPTNGIVSIGNTTAGIENSFITVNNNRISNFFNAATVTVGLLVGAGNTDWTITSNRLFQTAARVYTTANTHNCIQVASGNNYTITANVIGFSTGTFSGTYTMNSTVATRLIAINLAVGTATASSVQDNTITNILLTTSSGASTTNGILCAINVTAGNVNIGTSVPNTIGSTTGINALVANATTSNGMVVGINCSSAGAIAIVQNLIGGLTSTGTTAAISGNVTGINISGIAASLSITANTIGNNLPDNMRGGTSGLTTGSSGVFGINLPSTSLGTIVITANTIRNLSSYGTGAGGFVRGIMTAAASGNPNTYNISSNFITNLTSNNANTSISNGQAGVCGINISTGTNSVVNLNEITNLANIGTGAGLTFVAGITHGNATNTNISNNNIYNLTNAGTSVSTTAPSIVSGIVIRSGTTAVNVFNNMISLGTSQSTNTAIVGIMGNHGSTPDPIDRIYHNTINISGTVTAGAQPSMGIARTDFSLTARAVTMDIRNNIVTNTRTGGTGFHLAIANNYGAVASTTTGWGANASNNNVLNSNAATIGYWSSTPATFAGWQVVSASDAASFSGITVNYVNPATNLHLNMGVTPTVLESGGQTIASVLTDFDNQNRPGPTGSVNGGAFAPDLGADEFDGVYLDALPPAITYTPLNFTCVTTDRTLTATITDFSGVPTAGVLQPRIYFRKNANAWISAQGTLVTGNATNGTWSFTISTAAMGGLAIGDVVSYFVIAQDIVSPTANIVSNPAVGLVASDVNTVTTTPTTPSTYSISQTLAGTYTVGATGAFPTLTAAVNAYNTSCLNGAIVFSLIDPTYPSETFPIIIQSNPDASVVNTLTIKPATGNVAILTGSTTTAILVMNGADFVTINGSNGSVVNSTCPRTTATRDLTIINTNASTASAVVSLQTTAAGNAATNNRLMNCIITGNGSLTTGTVVNISGPTIGSGVGANNNSNNQIVNNLIQQGQVGIFSAGVSATTKNQNNTYSLNDLNATSTAALGRVGIMLLFEDAPILHSNNIGNIANSTSQDVMGITLGSNTAANSLQAGAETTNATVANNTISNLSQTNTFSCIGINIAATTVGTTNVTNNIVNRVFCNGTAGDFASALYYGGGTGLLNVYHNTLLVGGTTLTGASQPNIALGINGVTPTVDIRNNVIACTGDNGFAGNTGIGLAYTSTVGNYLNLTSNYNDIFVNGTSAIVGRVGSLSAGTPLTTLVNWQTETGRDANSVNVLPIFVSSSDLHLVAGSNPLLEDAALPLAAVTTDIDCATRDLCFVDMGADEFGTPREIDAQGNAISIVDGDNTPDVADGTDFDLMSVCNGTVARTFTLLNGGTTALAISGVTITGANAADFTVTTAPASTIAASGSTTFVVTFDPSAAGTRSATVTINSDDCNEAVYTFDVQGAGTEILASLSAQTNVTCNAGNNGTASVSVSGGMPTITYLWSSGGTNSTETNLIAGTYTCTVTDVNGCTSTQTVTITEPPAIVASVASQTNVSCNAGNNGAATVTASGGSGTLTYAWSSGGTAATETGLIAGTYTCTITDSLACSITQIVTITEPSAITTSVLSQTDVACNGGNTGSATVTASGGSGTLSYAWSSGGTTSTETGLVAGTYTCTITDSLSCVTTQTVTITEPAALVIATTSLNAPLCNGDSTGSITISISGGTPGYTIAWSSGGNGLTESNLTAGVYTATVTDTNGCVITYTDTLVEPPVIISTLVFINNPTTCGGTDGIIDISVSGGNPSYSFLWSNGPTTEDISGLAAGVYTCVTTDNSGCTSTITVTLSDPNPPVLTFSITPSVICESDASITLTASPAGGTFSGPGVTGNSFDPSTLNGAQAILYTYSDPNTLCQATANATITVDACIGIIDPAANGIAVNVYPNPNTGLFTIEAISASNNPLQVELINGLGQTVQSFTMTSTIKNMDISTLEGGIYFLRITDGSTVSMQRLIKQ